MAGSHPHWQPRWLPLRAREKIDVKKDQKRSKNLKTPPFLFDAVAVLMIAVRARRGSWTLALWIPFFIPPFTIKSSALANT